MSIGELLALDHQSLANHAQEGWGLANSRTADLVALAAELDRAMEENTRLRALNAEMLAAFRDIVQMYRRLGYFTGDDGFLLFAIAKNMIAKAEPQEQKTDKEKR